MKVFLAALPLACVIAAVAMPAHADDAASLTLSKAWVPVQAAAGVDVPLLLTITNGADAPDMLVRARCTAANFTELRVVDLGEGAPAPRVVKAVPIPAKGRLQLSDQKTYVALLQTTQPLPAGSAFDCTLTFRQAGPLDVHVVAASAAPAS